LFRLYLVFAFFTTRAENEPWVVESWHLPTAHNGVRANFVGRLDFASVYLSLSCFFSPIAC
jgi:hypothetical protein